MNQFRSFKFMTDRLPPPFLLIKTNKQTKKKEKKKNSAQKINLFSHKLLQWSPFPALPSLPDLLVSIVPDLTLILLEPCFVYWFH